MIKISNLTFQYPQSSKPALENVSLEIPSGSLTLVTGATGSGKSTLLRCMNGLVPHFSGGTMSGRVRVFDTDPISAGPELMAARVGFVFQEPETQFVFDIVEDEIAFALENAGVEREEMKRRVDQVIQQLRLEKIRGKNIHEISGGEMQKVAIASGLVNQPDVLILDEPTSQLDPTAANELLTLLTTLKSDLGLTVIISEHRLERLLPYTDFIVHLTPDRTLLFGTPQEILPQCRQVPPIIRIAQKLNISPLPLSVDDFLKIECLTIQNPAPPQRDPSSVDHDYALEIKALSTKFEGQQILKQVNIHLNRGEVLAVVGPNGAGKTTLLRSILGLIPSEGVRSLFGRQMSQLDLSEIIQHIAYLPQDPNDLLFAETIQDEMKFTLNNYRNSMTDAEVSAYLSLFGLAAMQDRYPRDLSVGERQRTALAAVTIHQPQIILLDEPTRGMDYQAKSDLSQLLMQWHRDDRAILLVTHDVEFAAGLSDRVAILEDGEISFTGSPKKAFSEFPAFQTQTARLFPGTGWITPEDAFPFLER